MKRKCPCHHCGKRHVEHGYNCHSDCPEHKEWHDEEVAERDLISKKRAEEAIVIDVRANAAYKQKKKNQNVKYWKG